MDMIQFEEAHTQWLRDCKEDELSGRQVAYAVCEDDGMDLHRMLSHVFFTANDAFRYACERHHIGFSFTDFLLVGNAVDASSVEELSEEWYRTDYMIIRYCGNEQQSRMYLMGRDEN